MVAHAEQAPSLSAAGDALRPDAVELPGAIRWVGRRVRLVHHVLSIVIGFRDAGELWMSDVMHGPKVSDRRKRRKTYLIAFIDDATRVIPFAAFAHSEHTTTFLPVFKQAIARRGLPARLFVDNGANFRSRQLAHPRAPTTTAPVRRRRARCRTLPHHDRRDHRDHRGAGARVRSLALPRLSGNGGDNVRNRAPLDQK